ncbi:unnamed protein product, partial [Amoebophrya sp. A120]
LFARQQAGRLGVGRAGTQGPSICGRLGPGGVYGGVYGDAAGVHYELLSNLPVTQRSGAIRRPTTLEEPDPSANFPLALDSFTQAECAALCCADCLIGP